MATPIIFEAPIEIEHVTKLIYNIEETKGPIDLYFSSEGGYVCVADLLIDYINAHPEKEITLVGYYNLSSAAFDVFLKTRCPKRFASRVHAILHRTVNTQGEDGTVPDYDIIDSKVWDSEQNQFFLERGYLTKKEMTSLRRKRDVLLSHERIVEIFKDLENNPYEKSEQGQDSVPAT